MWTNPKYDRPEHPRQPQPEPSGQLLASFPRPGRGHKPDEQLRVALDSFEGHAYVSIRLWFKGQDGRFWPSRKGCSIRLSEAENLADALGEAVRLAQFGRDKPALPRRDERQQRPGPSTSGPSQHRPALKATASARREPPAPPFDQNFDEFSNS